MQLERALINELDTGLSLNLATVSNRRSDFSLLLALMSQDIRDMAQFELEHSQADAEKLKLRKKFKLPAEETLIADLSTQTLPVDHSATFQAQGVIEFRLQQNLKPEAIVSRGKYPADFTEAINNCDIHVSRKINGIDGDKKLKSVPFITQLEQQRTMSKLIAQA
ncbi:queD-like protein [Parashewanella spongiae]|uniref:QueD-like protein n=1 Tax=Parashewanella spongiae TaxID=342950 RepID=A0A3A6TVG1_9GAMM|nr:VC2046/SO_2500 family protein [Parashewanella spongiae]MCL1077546.1 queD-like protein [Parashewanella spongiae]RJY18286.1 queD-like protein [Parashewanella spongiae]